MAMAKEKESGKYLWGTEVWHARLLDYDCKQGILKRMFASNRRNKTNNEDTLEPT